MTKKETVQLDLDLIVEEHADMVYRIAFVQMKQKSDAEDVFQDVFLQLVRYADTLKSLEHVKPWLIRVTINCCHKHHNKAWRKRSVAMAEEQFSEEYVETDGQVEDLLEATWELPEAQRLVIHLFYLEGYSIKEISQLLDQSESAIKTRLSRGRDSLRGKLKGVLLHER